MKIIEGGVTAAKGFEAAATDVYKRQVKKMQADWIGKSYGAEVDFPVEGRDEKITVYTCLLYTSRCV